MGGRRARSKVIRRSCRAPPSWSGQWQLGHARSRRRHRALHVARVRRRRLSELRAADRDVHVALHQGVGVPAGLQRRAPRHDAIRFHALVAASRRAGSRAGLRRARPPFGDEPRRILPGLAARPHVQRRARGNVMAAADRRRRDSDDAPEADGTNRDDSRAARPVLQRHAAAASADAHPDDAAAHGHSRRASVATW